MHAAHAPLPVNDVFFVLRDVVRDVVHGGPFHFGSCMCLQRGDEALRQNRPVREGVVGRSTHRTEVCLSFRGVPRCSGQLTVWNPPVVSFMAPPTVIGDKLALEMPDVIRAHLMAKPSASGVYHRDELALVQPPCLCCFTVDDLFDGLKFGEMVAAAQGAQAGHAALSGP